MQRFSSVNRSLSVGRKPSYFQRGGSSRAVAALILGIASWIVFPFLAGIAAWVLGKSELDAIRAGQGLESDRTIASIGMWLGIVNVVLSVLGTCIAMMFFTGLLAVIGLSAR